MIRASRRLLNRNDVKVSRLLPGRCEGVPVAMPRPHRDCVADGTGLPGGKRGALARPAALGVVATVAGVMLAVTRRSATGSAPSVPESTTVPAIADTAVDTDPTGNAALASARSKPLASLPSHWPSR
jgi:hypothetical protein